MLIVLPSNPATEKAAEYLKQQEVPHQVIALPKSINYQTGATLAIYFEQTEAPQQLMTQLSNAGHVIMRVFKEFKAEEK